MDSCGIDATYRVNATLNDRRTCDATVSDIDAATCSSTSTMTLTLLSQCRDVTTPELGQSAPFSIRSSLVYIMFTTQRN